MGTTTAWWWSWQGKRVNESIRELAGSSITRNHKESVSVRDHRIWIPLAVTLLQKGSLREKVGPENVMWFP